jgi:dienelactone hydrolase
MTFPFRKLLLGGCLACVSTLLSAAPTPSAGVSNWLSRPILSPTQTEAEVQAFTERRVPLMPEVRSEREWRRMAERLRREMLDGVAFRGEAAQWREAKTKVEWLDTINPDAGAGVEGGPGYRIKKLRYEALPGLWIPALLYEPDKLDGKVPVVLNLNGHEPAGKAVLNKQIRCINLAKRGMLVLNPEWLGFGQLNGPNYRHAFMNQLDLCGTSGLAPFYLAMQRGLDVLLSLAHADRERVAVSGLSGGGWQTIFLSALDPRVTLANPVAGYSSFRTRVHYGSDLGDTEQHPCDMATVLDYTHLTAMRAPRPTLLTYNAKDDCCFASDHALPPLLDAAQPVFKLLGKPENLRSHINHEPGTHNFDRENREAFYRMLGDHFYSGDKEFSPVEIPSDAEIKTAEQLRVELPANNADFHTLALALSKKLPRHSEIPSGKSALRQWQRSQRAKLRDLVRVNDYAVEATKVGGEETNGVKATSWQLKLGNDWTVPVAELSRGQPTITTIIVTDDGRKNAAAEVERQLAAGQRVLVVDLFYFGESKIGRFDVRYALLISAVGERPIGIQAGQLNAVAGWARSCHAGESVNVVAAGPRSSLIGLIAAALSRGGVDSLELHGALGSLKEIIENNWNVDQKPEMFCFGLLEAFDLKQLEALASPATVVGNQRPGGGRNSASKTD